jgi:hypothetical protein
MRANSLPHLLLLEYLFYGETVGAYLLYRDNCIISNTVVTESLNLHSDMSSGNGTFWEEISSLFIGDEPMNKELIEVSDIQRFTAQCFDRPEE